MNKQNKQLLQQMERAQQRIKYPSLPDHAVALTNWQDNSANALTKSIIGFLNMSGHFAERINTMGTYRQGRRLKVGDGVRQMPGRYVPTTGVKDLLTSQQRSRADLLSWKSSTGRIE